VTAYFYRSNGQLLGVQTTSFEVISSTIQWTVGYGGKEIFGQDFNITYSILEQPAKKLIGVDYNISLGWLFTLGS